MMKMISWTEKKSNEEMLNMVDEPRQFIKMLEIRTKFFGHVVRHNTFIINILEWKTNGNRRRPRETNLGNIKSYYL